MRFCRISMDSILSIYGFLWVSVFLNGLWISSGWAYVVVWVGGLRGLGYCDFLVSWRSGIFVFTASFPKGGQRVLVVHRPCTETPAGPAGPWESIGVQHSNVTFSDRLHPPPVRVCGQRVLDAQSILVQKHLLAVLLGKGENCDPRSPLATE